MPARCRLIGLVMLVCALSLASRAAAEAQRDALGPIHSAMTAKVVERLKKVLAASGGAKDAFVKVGDSNTANPSFLTCLSGGDVKLGAHAELEATRKFFDARKVDALHSSFDRISLSAAIGWLAGNALAGSVSPLVREISAVKPAFAVVMLGTNDNRVNGFEVFVKNLTELIDRTLSLGVVPLLSTLPPRDDSPSAAARVPELNRAIRDLAERRSVPLMDLYAALLPLPRHGLVEDGIHLSTPWDNEKPHGCWLTPDALQKGMNTRNLVVLTALHRVRRFLIENDKPEVESAPRA